MRWTAIGAVTASLLWFICWVLDARLGRRLMTSVGAWRLLDGGVSVAMSPDGRVSCCGTYPRLNGSFGLKATVSEFPD